MKKAILIIILCCSVISTSAIAKTKIAWFSSMNENEKSLTGFWITTRMFILAAAEDLDVELKIYYANRDYFMMVQKAKEIMSKSETKPDGIIFHNYKNQGRKILDLAEQYKVKALMFNAAFDKKEDIGLPREKYSQWIGQILPDDEFAGYLLATKLIKEAEKMERFSIDGKVHSVALEGNRASPASNARIRGFKRALQENKHVVNHQFFHSKWKESFAREAFKISRQRYPLVSMFWTASESMAIGVIKESKKEGWIPGRDFVTGGIDLLSKNMPYLISNEMAVSVGGHYVEGVFALIVLYDFLNGYDFAQNQTVFLQSKMFSLTGKDLKKIGGMRKILSLEKIRRYDYKKLSKKHNFQLKQYSFDIKKIIEQL